MRLYGVTEGGKESAGARLPRPRDGKPVPYSETKTFG